jgi:DNA polymerase elongation subunit (family B)
MSQEYRGEFHVYKECSEHALLEIFVLEVRLAAPRVFVTYNGDYVYWPFVEKHFTNCQACNQHKFSDWVGNQGREHR